MAKGDFTTAKEAAILGGDYSDAVFGTVAISNHDYICAINIGSSILILDSEEVSFFATLKKKGMSRKAANLIGATTHAVISTMVPGASLIGVIAGNTAAAAAGVATSGAAAHVAGGIRDYRDIIVVFRDQKKCIIRCSDLYFKKIKKYCEERKLSEYEIDKLLNIKSEPTSPKDSSKSIVEKERNQKQKENKSQPSSNTYHLPAQDKKEISSKVRVCPKCKKEISDGDKYCSGCGIKIETAILKCYNCDHKLKTDDNYCPSCGHPTKEAPQKSAYSPKTNTYESPYIESKESSKPSPAKTGQNNNINGIGGWLVVFVISLILSTINTFMNVRFFTREDCYYLREYGSDICYVFETFQTFEGLGLLFLGFISIMTIIFILGKRKAGQALGIVLPLLHLVFSIIDMIWLFNIIYSPTYNFPSGPVNTTTGQVIGNLLGIIVYCSVWIPYLLCSQRVRNTLTKGRNENIGNNRHSSAALRKDLGLVLAIVGLALLMYFVPYLILSL